MQSSPPSQSLDTFFNSEDQVLVIRGAWGVGKTYLWDKYIKTRQESGELTQIAYSYVSLFGKSSLADIRVAIFQNAKQISTDERVEQKFDEQIAASTDLLAKAPWVRETGEKVSGKVRFMGWLTNLARYTPYTDKYSSIIASLEYSLVKDYIVCFDDLERKSSALSVREVMSLADELARRKNCKVVLIFNDNSFSDDKDKKEFEAYREKVVDAELDFAPSHADNLACVFARNDSLFPKIEPIAIALDLKNIRVIKKLKRLIDAFRSLLGTPDELVWGEFLNHASVLCWSYFLRAEALPYDYVKNRLGESSWASYFGTKEDELTPDEKRYRAISNTVQLSPSIFDSYICAYLERGHFDEESFKREVADLGGKVDVQKAHAELNKIWKRYTDTFAENEAELVLLLNEALSKNVEKINVSEYSSALELLAELGEDVSAHMDRYVTLHGASLAQMDRHDSIVARRVTYKPLLDRIKAIQAQGTSLDIDQVTMGIAINRGWNPEDIDFLASLSKHELTRWILSEPADLSTKLRGGLLFFGGLQGGSGQDTKKFETIYRTAKSALAEIASSNKLNQKRVKQMYDIDPE